uniref:Ribosomal protein S14 n=1 Tax=Sargassum ilicifolium TaxID=246892 RepID=A0A1S5QK84_9PHAE|nr:ribosomal protein S14 [Sargassum phyllocystum]YP_010401998.1 ribosomal protein S14 [Sargassum mcclurei]YP_010402035.1 ribosomal protein S14 [Sargassum henslowianum]AMJ17060.1 ribosomal protein S14 [Sargassum ilicifolium]UQV81099.1 ribosomal protein S14 [Sargassum phyllocystum]UQV81173.1 ribosomal protein S14 [Sargassum mcclurei]UQV81210.1 ribosomal protein S14 [Sargassum henslowianum]
MKNQDSKRRNLFFLHESRRKTLNVVAANQNLSIFLRWWAQLEKSKLPRQSSICRVKNRCVETHRSRSVINVYKLSRLEFRRLASRGFFLGMRKSSW